jgi:putative PIN family toxin of toxin-antitoxin system
VLSAVLDCNVYVSAIIRPEGPPGLIVDRFVRASAFDLVVSPAIRAEMLAALAYPKVRKSIRRQVDASRWFEDIVVLARLVPGEAAVTAASADPDDDVYIAAAIEGRCAYIVTGDPDLLVLEEHAGIQIVTPREFLTLLERQPTPPEAGF